MGNQGFAGSSEVANGPGNGNGNGNRHGSALAGLVAGWRSGHGSLPATPAGVETCALAVFLGIRVIVLVQLALSLPTALRDTTSSGLFIAVLAGYVAESVALGIVLVWAGEYRDRRLGWVDTATAVLVLLAQPSYIAPRDITGNWTAWGFACTLGTAVGAGIVFTRRRDTALAVVALGGSYLAASLPLAAPGPMRTTVIANVFSYAGFAVLPRLLVGYLRRLGADVERARQAAAEAAAEAARLTEVDRQRTLLHDNISILRLLARTDLSPELGEPLRGQAVALANKVRAFLDEASDAGRNPGSGRDGAGAIGDRLLTDVVYSAAAGFTDLPLDFNLDLAADVSLDGEATLLYNVRLHAHASDIVIHADADPVAGTWEITVRDNGCGFDLATAHDGFGLRVQVAQGLVAHGIRAEVRSSPGDGTAVILEGPWRAVP